MVGERERGRERGRQRGREGERQRERERWRVREREIGVVYAGDAGDTSPPVFVKIRFVPTIKKHWDE